MIESNKEKYVLLLTATVNPEAYKDHLKQNLLQARTQEYTNSLISWINAIPNQVSGIVFCENSNSDLIEIIEKVKPYLDISETPIEWLTFNGNHRVDGVHYGYSELGIIDYALENSSLLKNSNFFIKATGRLIFKDTNKLLTRIKQPIAFAADCHFYKRDKKLPVRMRTQFFISNKEFYKKHLYRKRDEMPGQCSHIEEFLMIKIWPLRNHSGVILRFPCECLPSGYSASMGTSYGSLVSLLKSKVRGVLRILTPHIWL